MHVHVYCEDGEAKYWLEPNVELAHNYRLLAQQLKEIQSIVEVHEDEFKAVWRDFFGR